MRSSIEPIPITKNSLSQCLFCTDVLMINDKGPKVLVVLLCAANQTNTLHETSHILKSKNRKSRTSSFGSASQNPNHENN